MFVANLCVYKSKKLYNPRYIQEYQIIISIKVSKYNKYI